MTDKIDTSAQALNSVTLKACFSEIDSDLTYYRCHEMCDDEGIGYQLMDALTIDGGTVDMGVREIDRISDMVCGIVSDHMTPVIAERDALCAEVDRLRGDAARYQWLRSRDPSTIRSGGVFVGMTPQNCVINAEHLDLAVDNAMQADARAALKGGDA